MIYGTLYLQKYWLNALLMGVLSCLSPSQHCLGQVPGFEGKRAMLGATVSVFPAIRPRARGQDSVLRVNVRWGVEAEYILSRRVSIGASYKHLETRFWYEIPGGNGLGRIHAHDAGVFVKTYNFFRRGNIAPIGIYQKLEVLAMRYRATDVDRKFFSDGRDNLGRYTDLGIILAVGTQRVWARRIVTNIGIQFGTVLGVLNKEGTERQQEIKSFATERLQGHYFANLNIGVNILLF